MTEPLAEKDTYWAARPSDRCVGALLDRIKKYREAISRSGRGERMLRAWSTYHGLGVDGLKSSARLLPGGEQGELTLIAPPAYATLVRQTERLITGQKPAYKTIAANSDSDSIVEAMLGDALLDYYDRTAALTQRENEGVRSGLVLGSGYVALGWNTAVGQTVAVDPESGKEFKEGDLWVRHFTPWDVAFDTKDTDERQRQWFAFRSPQKKFDLIAAAQTEELKKRILSSSEATKNLDLAAETPFATPWRKELSDNDEDNVWVWELRHSRTAALPNGRLLRFIDKDTVLYDSAAIPAPIEGVEGQEASAEACQACGCSQADCQMIQGDRCCEECAHAETPAVEAVEANPDATTDAGYPYPDLLAYEFCPETALGTGLGHTAHFDLLGLQEAVEAMTTAGMSNINMGAVTNWWVGMESSPEVQRLSTGANIIKSKTKPETIDGVQISEAMMAFLELVRGFMKEAVGHNDVSMGETQKGMPAQLAALMEAKAIQYHQSGQAAYYELVRRVRTGVLKLLQRFATEPRVVALVGKANAWALKSWSQRDISKVTTVVVEPVNPMMKTFAGRVAMIDALGPDLSRDSKISLYLTGSLEEKLDGPKAHEGRLAREKEMLREGKGMPPVDMEKTNQAMQQYALNSQAAAMQGGPPPPEPGPVFAAVEGEFIRPLESDPHWLDIPEYLSVLASPEARANGKVVTACLDLVTEKLRLWRNMSPDLIALLGGMPAPSTMAAMGMPPPGAPPPDAKKPPPKAGGMPTDGTTKPVSMPKPPENPLDGSQAPPPVPAA